MSTFGDVLAGNDAYARTFRLAGLDASAARGLAVLTCIDSRIEPLAMLGLEPGDAKILRNAGARVTDDVLRTLVLASYLLGEEELHAAIDAAGGPDTRSVPFLVAGDQERTLQADLERVRSSSYLARLEVGGFLYDVHTGRLSQIC
jgi:carbonic anhydrase